MSQPDRPRRALNPEQQALVTQHIAIAERLCGTFLRQTRAYHVAEDIRSIAFEVLYAGALGYDPARGPFPSYIWRRIDGALADFLKQESKHWGKAREDAYDVADEIEDTSDVLNDTDAETTAHVDAMAGAFAAAPVLALVGRALRAGGEERDRLRADYGRLLRAAEAALSALPDDARRVLVSHHVEGRTWQEVGVELGCSERTARRRGAEAARRFAAALREQGGSSG